MISKMKRGRGSVVTCVNSIIREEEEEVEKKEEEEEGEEAWLWGKRCLYLRAFLKAEEEEVVLRTRAPK